MNKEWAMDTSPWINCDLDTWKSLTKGQIPVMYRKNTFLFHQDDSASFVYIVQKGRLRITYFNPEGMEKQLYIAEQGGMCGEDACICQNPHTFSALAIVDSSVYKISMDELLTAMKRDWELNQLIFRSVCRKNAVYRNQIIELSLSQAIQRIAQLLLNLCRQYGTTVSDGCKIAIRFTHSDVADMINTSRVTVSNIVNMMVEHGYLIKKDSYFIIRDISILEELSEGRRDL